MAEEIHHHKSHLVQTWVQIIALVGAFLWGVYTFVYQQTIVPRHLPPYLTVTSELQKAGENGSLISVRGNIRVKNNSKTRVWVVAAWYNAYGMRIVPEDLNDEKFTNLTNKYLTQGDGEFPRQFGAAQLETVFTGKFMDGFWFDPDDEWAKEIQFYIVKGKYDRIQFDVDVDMGRDNKLVGAKWRVGPDPSNQGEQIQSGVLWAQACMKASEAEKDLSKCEILDSEKNPKHKSFEDKYALSHTSSIAELSLWDGNKAGQINSNP